MIIPKNSSVEFINLSQLRIPEQYLGNQLAESRIFLSDILERSLTEYEYIGIIPARWNARFPEYELNSAVTTLLHARNNNVVVAPMASTLRSRNSISTWIRHNDLFHPGISRYLNDIQDSSTNNQYVGKAFEYQPVAILSNTFLIHSSIFQNLLQFWRENFFQFLSSDFPKYDFTYRCRICGFISSDGVGRFDNSRHSGFLGERLTSLFFLSKENLKVVLPDGNSPEYFFSSRALETLSTKSSLLHTTYCNLKIATSRWIPRRRVYCHSN